MPAAAGEAFGFSEGATVGVAGLGVGFGVGVSVSTGTGVGAGVAFSLSFTAWAIEGPAVTPVTAVPMVMTAPITPMPIGPRRKVPNIRNDSQMKNRQAGADHESAVSGQRSAVSD